MIRSFSRPINLFANSLILLIGDSTSVESSLQIDPFYAKQSQFQQQKSEDRIQKKVNMYKSGNNKEIRTPFFGRIPLMTLCILSGIGIKTKPIRTQNEANFYGRTQKSEDRRKKCKTKPII